MGGLPNLGEPKVMENWGPKNGIYRRFKWGGAPDVPMWPMKLTPMRIVISYVWGTLQARGRP